MSLDNGDMAGIVGGSITLLGAIGGGVRWLLTSRSKREQWIEARIQQHVAKIEARLGVAERRADHLGFAFQLVAAELARLDPNSDILRRAQLIIEGVQGLFTPRELPPEHADALDELYERTK
ncbi:hypothetical protein ACFOMD_01640 [Sphingoaurantiacus capsulatus]|uniref:Uncharacterized protein n=1 Tax=Sphingoaurantiacus capsulatus TaxID=1771310 RepID=A0ABV7X7T7_9SPHN